MPVGGTAASASCPGGPVDRLADEVGVAVVAGVLLDHVEVDPAHVDSHCRGRVLPMEGDDFIEVVAGGFAAAGFDGGLTASGARLVGSGGRVVRPCGDG